MANNDVNLLNNIYFLIITETNSRLSSFFFLAKVEFLKILSSCYTPFTSDSTYSACYWIYIYTCCLFITDVNTMHSFGERHALTRFFKQFPCINIQEDYFVFNLMYAFTLNAAILFAISPFLPGKIEAVFLVMKIVCFTAFSENEVKKKKRKWESFVKRFGRKIN